MIHVKLTPYPNSLAGRRLAHARLLDYAPIWVPLLAWLASLALAALTGGAGRSLLVFTTVMWIPPLGCIPASIWAMWRATWIALPHCELGRREELAMAGISLRTRLEPLLRPGFERSIMLSIGVVQLTALLGSIGWLVLLWQGGRNAWQPVLFIWAVLGVNVAAPATAVAGIGWAIASQCRSGDSLRAKWTLVAWSHLIVAGNLWLIFLGAKVLSPGAEIVLGGVLEGISPVAPLAHVGFFVWLAHRGIARAEAEFARFE